MSNEIIIPEWDAPKNVKSIITTRQGGYSQAPFNSFNLAEHVDDKPVNVKHNRQHLMNWLPAEPIWLNQVHSNAVIEAHHANLRTDADGSYTTSNDCVSVVMTADCLPVLICNLQGNVVAAVHAGWRGLLNGILVKAVEKVIRAGQCQARDLLVWLGPAIGPEQFEVGEEVRQKFLAQAQDNNFPDRQHIEHCFSSVNYKKNKYLADIYQLARSILVHQGVANISGGNYCTYSEEDKFFSYRRDGKTGRMASLIWLEKC